eukprot:403339210
MSNQAPKFLLGGVNFRRNFLGLQTVQTAIYGVAEAGIKFAPLFLIGYAANSGTFYTKERDSFLDETKRSQAKEVRRESF